MGTSPTGQTAPPLNMQLCVRACAAHGAVVRASAARGAVVRVSAALSSAQKKGLKSVAQRLLQEKKMITMQVGKQGLTDNVKLALDEALAAREIVKARRVSPSHGRPAAAASPPLRVH